jgi:CRISPR-associated protein Cmr2
MACDWDDLLLAYLHDPPDKALNIRGHEHPAAELASRVVWWEVSPAALHRDTRTADQLAAAAERVPLPTAGPKAERAVGVVDGRLLVYHPLSGTAERLEVGNLDHRDDGRVSNDLVAGFDPPRQRFLLLWRSWREQLAQRNAAWARLPADTRQPDHTIWNHTDIAAGLQAALAGNHGAAFLSFSLGPVQTFIAAARTMRDLWTGSYLLAWLTFQALRPILDDSGFGPAVVVSPALRGVPLMDLYLCEPRQGFAERVAEHSAERLLAPCLPNRFTAVVPWGPDGADAKGLARACVEKCQAAWNEVSGTVFEKLEEQLRRHPVRHKETWDRRRWEEQARSFFEYRTALLPWRECDDAAIGRLLASSGRFADALPDAEAVRSLEQAIPPGDRYGFAQDAAGRWQGRQDLLGRLAEAARSVRHVPDYRPSGDVPQKCSLLGSYEQMGPARLEHSREFWQDFARHVALAGTRTRKNERLCAISLIKRFAWPAYLAGKLGLPTREGRFADTATVAAALWLAEEPRLDPKQVWKQEERWSGQWLHWSRRDQEKDEGEPEVPNPVWTTIQTKRRQKAPPTYYAALLMDGDDMGQWLQGQKGPTVGEVLHPTLQAYFQALPKSQRGLQARRPVGPALHASISEAVSNFALHFVPAIVEGEPGRGELIYAGGDDVLALLPTLTAIECARQLARTVAQDWGRKDGQQFLLMGHKATVSAGLAVVHHKDDLRFALEAARRAEKAAKGTGKDALALTVCRRSGEHTSVVLPWSLTEQLQKLLGLFVEGVPDRWTYRLRGELPTLLGPELPWEAVRAEVRRLLDRVEDPRKDELSRLVGQFLDDYRGEMKTERRGRSDAEALEGFVTLCQSAAFLARGRDER